ncbi:hypothetical protein BG004_000708 [Podila humilis]|nr:hypothetical protein BG004_000708 [Podila humilis]
MFDNEDTTIDSSSTTPSTIPDLVNSSQGAVTAKGQLTTPADVNQDLLGTVPSDSYFPRIVLDLKMALLPFDVSSSRPRSNPPFGSILDRVSQTTIAAQAHQDLPFDQVVEVVNPPRRTDITPIFQVMLAWQNLDLDSLYLDNEKSSVEDNRSVVKFVLDLELLERNGEIVGEMNYSTALFDRETIERHVRRILGGQSEQELLLETWNATDVPYPDDKCVHQLFENQVNKSPDAIAVVHNNEELTYRESNSRANWIGRQLLEAGVKPSDYVMLLLERSVDLVASQIAVLKIGAAYVPIDTKAPLERQTFIASDCRSTVAITDDNAVVPTEIQGTVLRLAWNRDDIELMQGMCDVKGYTGSSCETAYIMHTSDSTGRPKGVAVPHQGIARLVLNNGYTKIATDDCIGFTINPSFDPGTFEVWSTLLHGTRLVIIDKDTILDAQLLEDLILRHQTTNRSTYLLDELQEIPVCTPWISIIGYLNRPDLAAEQFIADRFSKERGGRMFATRDIDLHLHEGNLVFAIQGAIRGKYSVARLQAMAKAF